MGTGVFTVVFRRKWRESCSFSERIARQIANKIDCTLCGETACEF
jgi:hypothetical protein